MFTQQDIAKMDSFVSNLISNPCFKSETPLSVEEHVILFLIQNMGPLRATLTTANFFPNLDWRSIEQLYLEVLMKKTDSSLLNNVEFILTKKIDFQFMNQLLNRQIPPQKFSSQIYNVLIKVLKRFEVRRAFDSIFKNLYYNIIDKYIQEIYSKRSYIVFELEKVEKLRFPPELVSSYIKFNMMISVIGQIKADFDDTMSLQQKMNIVENKFGNYAMQKNYYSRLIKQYKPDLGYFSDEIINKALASNISFIDDNTIPATCRLAKVFYLLGKSYRPNVKVDKGAETFEKSWFQLQKKNYKFFGFDIKMIEELYRISAENYW